MLLCCITAGLTSDCCSKVDIFVMECEMQQPQCGTAEQGALLSQTALPPQCPRNRSLSLVKLELLSCRAAE